jgi:hypothetical protein
MIENPNQASFNFDAPHGMQECVDMLLQFIYTGAYSREDVPNQHRTMTMAMEEPHQAEIAGHGILRCVAEDLGISGILDLTLEKQRAYINQHIMEIDLEWLISPYYLGWRGTGYIPPIQSWLQGHDMIISILAQRRQELEQKETFRKLLRASATLERDLGTPSEVWRRRSYCGLRTCQCPLPVGFRLECRGCGLLVGDGQLESLDAKHNTEDTEMKDNNVPQHQESSNRRMNSPTVKEESHQLPHENRTPNLTAIPHTEEAGASNASHAASQISDSHSTTSEKVEYRFNTTPSNDRQPLNCRCPYPTEAAFLCCSCEDIISEFVEEMPLGVNVDTPKSER